MSLRIEFLKLYRDLLRTCFRIQHYNYREYAIRRISQVNFLIDRNILNFIIQDFRRFRGENDLDIYSKRYKEGVETLAQLNRIQKLSEIYPQYSEF